MQTAEAALVVAQVGLGRWEALEGGTAAAVEAWAAPKAVARAQAGSDSAAAAVTARARSAAAATVAAEKAQTRPPHCP